MSLAQLKSDLRACVKPGKKELLERFFKTGKGEYGESDRFLGVMVPEQREVAKKHRGLGLKDIQRLLDSKIHEHRLTALFMLVDMYKLSDDKQRKAVFDFYLKNTKNINNWDLVDLSAPKIVGHYLLDKDRKVLYRLARSRCLWERRISVLATYSFISKGQYGDTLKICEMLLGDRHDLMQKAAGWMLREIGKRDISAEESFLDKYCKVMPRTMLRYAVERFDDKKKMFYMRR